MLKVKYTVVQQYSGAREERDKSSSTGHLITKWIEIKVECWTVKCEQQHTGCGGLRVVTGGVA